MVVSTTIAFRGVLRITTITKKGKRRQHPRNEIESNDVYENENNTKIKYQQKQH